MDTKEIINQAIRDGYYLLPNNVKVIYDLAIFKKDFESILNNSFRNDINTLAFASFRAALYQINKQSAIHVDFKLYQKYLINMKVNDLCTNTIKIHELINIESNKIGLKEMFINSIKNSENTFVISSFHYSTYKILFNYLINNGFQIYLIASNRVINSNLMGVELLTEANRYLYGADSNVKCFSSEDIKSMVMLADEISKNKNTKSVLLLFPDGNTGADNSSKNNRDEKLIFFNQQVNVKKGIFMFAEMFDLPIYNVFVSSINSDKITIHISDFVKSPKQTKINGNSLIQNYYETLENILSKECNLPNWECWVYLHKWLETGKLNNEDFGIIDEESFDETRFTLINVENTNFLFDSKYYLSYQIADVNNQSIRNFVIENKIGF